MKKDHWQERISEYLDGELTAAEAQRFEEHLASCGDCQSILSDLSVVIAQAGQLPLPQPPPAMWEHITQRLAAQGLSSPQSANELRREPVASEPAPALRAPTRRGLPMRWALAAGLVLAALSAGSGWWLRGPQGEPAPRELELARPTLDAAPIVPVRMENLPPEVVSALADYAQSVTQLEAALERVADRMDPESYESIQGNLYTIDRAIFEAHAALNADPQSEYLNAHLANSMARKVRLLQQATRLASNQI